MSAAAIAACSDNTKPFTGDGGDGGGADGDGGGGDAGPVPTQCNPLNPKFCMLPWPSSFYLKEDTGTPTGWRVNYSADSLPATLKGAKLDPTRWNLRDGFSPSAQPLAYFEGGVSPDGLVGENDDYAKSLEPTSLVQIIDFSSGERVPLFAEVEQNALRPGFDKYKSSLLIRPALRFKENQRYVVVIRVGLKDQSGKALAPPEAFRQIRDGETTGDPTIDNEAKRLEPVLKFVEGKGIARKDMLLVWDFHTSSGESVRGNTLFMVDDALARVAKLTDGPAYTITTTEDDFKPEIARKVVGTISVPSYLATDDVDSWLKRDADGKPVYRGMQDFGFQLHIPACAKTATGPLPVMIFGHGLFGNPKGEMESDYQRKLIDRLCMVQVGVKWIGLSSDDRAAAATQVITKWSNFPRLTDRLMQAQVNFAVLVELIAAGKLLADPKLQINGKAVSDGSEMYYYGISNGAIQGFAFTALQKRITRSVLQVGGGPWSLLEQRSADFLAFVGLVLLDYPDPTNLALLVALSQQFFDATDPTSYAGHIIKDPLTGRPVKKVIVQEAKFDPLVSNLTTRYAVRTMGIPLMTPRHDAVYGVPEKPAPLDSAYVQWDTKKAWRPPAGNLTPTDKPEAADSPHEALRRTESCTLQLEAFFKPDGKVEQTCTGPCTDANPI